MCSIYIDVSVKRWVLGAAYTEFSVRSLYLAQF